MLVLVSNPLAKFRASAETGVVRGNRCRHHVCARGGLRKKAQKPILRKTTLHDTETDRTYQPWLAKKAAVSAADGR